MSDEQPDRRDEDTDGSRAQRDPEDDRERGDASSAPAAQPRDGASDTTA